MTFFLNSELGLFFNKITNSDTLSGFNFFKFVSLVLTFRLFSENSAFVFRITNSRFFYRNPTFRFFLRILTLTLYSGSSRQNTAPLIYNLLQTVGAHKGKIIKTILNERHGHGFNKSLCKYIFISCRTNNNDTKVNHKN